MTRRLHRSDCHGPGITRRRRGRGFSYQHPSGAPVDRDTFERIHALAIPPAWQDVWICPSPAGHIQAWGIDAAGRRQYVYHSRWRQKMDRRKFDRAVELGAALPAARRLVTRHLRTLQPSRRRLLAAAFRLLDSGAFRVGSEQYAATDGGIGLATLRCGHARVTDGCLHFDYPGKAAQRQRVAVSDPEVIGVLRPLLGRARSARLLASQELGGWRPITSADINDYVRDAVGEQFTAKDFRTWRATVLAAEGLARRGVASSQSGQRQAIRFVLLEVAARLGNTLAVARSAYVDPRVLDLYRDGVVLNTADGNAESGLRVMLQSRY
jgi:DNA topoisomerase I